MKNLLLLSIVTLLLQHVYAQTESTKIDLGEKDKSVYQYLDSIVYFNKNDVQTSKILFEYDKCNRLSYSIEFIWNNDTDSWEYKFQTDYTYNYNGILIEKAIFSWNNNKWEDSLIVEESNIPKEKPEFNTNDIWKKNDSTKITYYFNNDQIFKIKQEKSYSLRKINKQTTLVEGWYLDQISEYIYNEKYIEEYIEDAAIGCTNNCADYKTAYNDDEILNKFFLNNDYTSICFSYKDNDTSECYYKIIKDTIRDSLTNEIIEVKDTVVLDWCTSYFYKDTTNYYPLKKYWCNTFDEITHSIFYSFDHLIKRSYENPENTENIKDENIIVPQEYDDDTYGLFYENIASYTEYKLQQGRADLGWVKKGHREVYFSELKKSTSTKSFGKELDFLFSISPNPVKNTIHIKSERGLSDCLVSIYNANGKCIMQDIRASEIDVSDVSAGNYILCFTVNNAVVETQNIVIE